MDPKKLDDANIGHRSVSRRDILLGASAVFAGGSLAAASPVRKAVCNLPLATAAAAPLRFARAVAGAGPASAVLQQACVLTPSLTAGPYYLNLALLRRAITEGKMGLPLTVYFLVVRQSTCQPVDAVVDLWHCDALGGYSGVASLGTAGQTFLRGIQATSSGGIVAFDTIYPGYYPGRTVHFHLKVHVNGQPVLTTQTYFDDRLTDAVFASLSPYNTRPARATRNANDPLFRSENTMAVIANPDGSLSLWAGLILVVP